MNQPFLMLPRDKVEEEPRAFLWRRLFEADTRLKSTQPDHVAHALAAWETTNTFLLFMRWLWLDGLGIEPFQPAKFFVRPDEVEAFTEFKKRRCK